jgi:hypothetical protein
MLPVLGTIAAHQAKATANNARAVYQLCDYAHTHPGATICYCSNDMILCLHSNASYLSKAHACSRGAGRFYLGDKPSHHPACNKGALLVTLTIMRKVMSSAAKAKCGALFNNNTKDAIPLRITLEEMGHPQPPTPVNIDNSTTVGFANQTMKQRKSKSMDMRFYWIQDRVKQKQFDIHWRPGTTNLADYFTKHHATSHHRKMRPTYLQSLNNIVNNIQQSLGLRGCVNPSSWAVWLSTVIQDPEPQDCLLSKQYPTRTNATRYSSLIYERQ